MAAALACVGGLYALTTHRSQADHMTRAVGSPAVKMTATGASVRWRTEALDVVVDDSFSKLAGPQVYGAAVDAWRATGATLPSVSTKPGDGRKVGYDPGGKNENVIVYAPYGWSKANGALAVTVLTYDDMTGAIVDADVLINGGGRFFGVLDEDESDPSSAGVSIEGKDGSDAFTTIKSGKTPRFDVQNVLTHELGHFFGLGEDYTDTRTTMYASTRPGETNKRIVSASDGSVVSALYAEPVAAASLTQAGCGGAKLARGQMPHASGIVGFGAAAAGLILLAASRRGRAARLVPVRARRRRGLARFGGWLTVFSTFALLSPPRLEAAPSDQATRGADAEVQVTDATTRWTDGILETELRLHVTACHVANCSSVEEQKVVVPGGHFGGVTQVVGPYAVPAVGERVAIRYREPRSLLQPFHPNPYYRP